MKLSNNYVRIYLFFESEKTFKRNYLCLSLKQKHFLRPLIIHLYLDAMPLMVHLSDFDPGQGLEMKPTCNAQNINCWVNTFRAMRHWAWPIGSPTFDAMPKQEWNRFDTVSKSIPLVFQLMCFIAMNCFLKTWD